jgi:RecB family endonuclease NucS
MEVYLVEQDDMKQVTESELDREAKLERRLVRTDGAKIGDVEVLYVGRQGSPGEGGVFDILGVDERGDTVVVELKRGRAPRDVVAQALEYAGEIRNVDYDYLNERYREFLRNEQGYTDRGEIPSLREAHREYFDLEDPLSEREFNDDQRLVVVGTDFGDVVLNMADFLREKGIDVIAVEYSTYRDSEEGIELLTTDGIRRPLSEEPSTASSTSRTDAVDYSDLIFAVRDRVYTEVDDLTQHESPDEMQGSGSRNLTFSSKHPEHPDLPHYGFTPRIEEGGTVAIRIGIFGGDDHEKQRVFDVIVEEADELDGFEQVSDSPGRAIVAKEIDVAGEESDEIIERTVSELVRLIEFYHPKFVEKDL